jgi:hypothetical protein
MAGPKKAVTINPHRWIYGGSTRGPLLHRQRVLYYPRCFNPGASGFFQFYQEFFTMNVPGDVSGNERNKL